MECFVLEGSFKDHYFSCLAMIRDVFREICMRLFFKVSVDVMPSFKPMNCTIHVDVICKFVEGAFNPTVHVITKDNDLYWSQYGPSKDTAWFPLGHGAIDCNSLDMAIQPISYPFNSPSVKPTPPKIVTRMLWRMVSKTLQKSKQNDNSSTFLAHWCSHSIIEG